MRSLADPIRIDSSSPEDPMAQLAVVLLALFAQMERTYTLERAAHARAVAEAKGRRVGRPVTVSPDRLRYAAHLREQGHTVAEIVAETGIPRTSLYRHLPPSQPRRTPLRRHRPLMSSPSTTVALPPRQNHHRRLPRLLMRYSNA